MSRFRSLLVELVFRISLILVSIILTIQVFTTYSYTYIQYVIVYMQLNSSIHSVDTSDAFVLHILYTTFILHLPIIVLHSYMYITSMLRKHEVVNSLLIVLPIICLVYFIDSIVGSVLIPMYTVISTDVRYSISLDVLYTITDYVVIYMIILLGIYILVFTRYILLYIECNVTYISIYRRIYLISIIRLYAVQEDVSTDGWFIIVIMLTLVVESVIIIHIVYYNVFTAHIRGCSAMVARLLCKQ